VPIRLEQLLRRCRVQCAAVVCDLHRDQISLVADSQLDPIPAVPQRIRHHVADHPTKPGAVPPHEDGAVRCVRVDSLAIDEAAQHAFDLGDDVHLGRLDRHFADVGPGDHEQVLDDVRDLCGRSASSRWNSCCSASEKSSGRALSSSASPTTVVSGVRNSCDTEAMNWSFD
jgi:hypothetical protein